MSITICSKRNDQKKYYDPAYALSIIQAEQALTREYIDESLPWPEEVLEVHDADYTENIGGTELVIIVTCRLQDGTTRRMKFSQELYHGSFYEPPSGESSFEEEKE